MNDNTLNKTLDMTPAIKSDIENFKFESHKKAEEAYFKLIEAFQDIQFEIDSISEIDLAHVSNCMINNIVESLTSNQTLDTTVFNEIIERDNLLTKIYQSIDTIIDEHNDC